MDITITRMVLALLVSLTLATPAMASLPERGMSKDAVRQQYGSPNEQRAAVGTPPISRWIYSDFTVYFEADYTIHAVMHPRAPAQPAVTAPASATVDELPEIDVIDPDDDQPAPAETDATTAEEAPDAAPESQFRFDPATGRIVEIGPDGEPLTSPTAQPARRPAQQEEAPAEVTPAPASEPVEPVRSEPAQPEPAPQPEPTPAPAERSEQPEPAASEPAEQPEAEDDQPSFRFDPATGRIVPVGGSAAPATPEAEAAPQSGPGAEPAAEPEPAPEPQAEPEPQPEPEPAPAPQPEPSTTEQPAATPDRGSFRFDPATGQMVPADSPSEPQAPASEPAPRSEPTPEPGADGDAESDDGGFSIEW